MTLEAGIRVGKYVVGRQLGKGGFGILHVARDTELGRDVAIKFLKPEHAFRPQIVQRFLQEARAAARVSHPGIVVVHESGIVGGTNTRADGTVFIAMELLTGETLEHRLDALGKMPIAQAVGIARQLAAALAAAHTSSIVHRDLKPQNIFLVRDSAVVGGERVKILDFGIAKLVDEFGSNVQTHSMLMLGTPMYMSPEQCKSSAKVDARSDIYSLGCILFELVVGRPPFNGDSGELIAKHQLVPPPTPRSLNVPLPPALEALILAMLAKSPDDRPQTMDAVLDALHAIEEPEAQAETIEEPAPVIASPAKRSPRNLFIGAGAAIALGIAVGAISVHSGGSKADEPVQAEAVVVTRDAAVVVAPPPVVVAIDAATESSRLRLDCLRFQSDKQWQDLTNCANRLMASDSESARALMKKAKTEQANELQAGKIDDAIKDGNIGAARKLLDKIDDESVYKQAAAGKVADLEKAIVDQFVAKAEKLKAANKCADVDILVAQARKVSPVIGEVVATYTCGKVATATPEPPANCDGDALEQEARDQEAFGQHGAALAKFEKAIACKPTERRYSLAFMAACNAGNRPKAKYYYKKSGPTRASVAQMCVRNGITVADLEAP